MNKSKQISRTGNNESVHIGLKEIDIAISNYMKNIIDPTVIENNLNIKVPIYHANPERWKSIRKDGFFRDQKSNQIMLPVIVFKRNSISKNQSMPMHDLDNNIFKLASSKWSAKNKFDTFSISNGLEPSEEYFYVLMPKYINLSYSVIIWTKFIEHMNFIIEKFMFAENRYWGEFGYKFKTTYDSIDTSVESSSGEDRFVKGTFNMTTSAYILPKDYNDKLTTLKMITPSKIIINTETSLDREALKNSMNI